MRYYIIEVQHTKEGAESRQFRYAYDDLFEAKKRFHLLLGAFMNEESLDWAMVVIIGSDRNIYASERFDRAIEVEQEEIEEESVHG